MNLKREYVKRSIVLCVLILCATLARMITDGAGVTVDPYEVLGKVAKVAAFSSTIFMAGFALADLAFGDLKLPRFGVGKSALLLGALIMGTQLAAILGGYGN